MKRLILILFCFCLFFCGCSKNKTNEPVAESQATTNNIDMAVAAEISKIENVSNFDNETIKALSVVIRTNLIDDENKINSLNKEYNNIDDNIYNIVSETSGKVLSQENENKINTIYINNQEEQSWTKEIKKVDILKFMKKNKISLASVSNIEPKKDKTGRTISLDINGKILPFENVMNEFDIPSNNIDKIENTLTSIKIYGKGVGNGNNFDLNLAETQAKAGFGYEKILKNSYNNFKIITRK